MALTVGTDTYISETDFATWAMARGITIAGTKETLLRKAMDYIEIQQFQGEKTEDTQDLQFPRYPDTTVPANIITAQCVAAYLIDTGVNLFATVDRAIKREKVDVIEIEYQVNAGEAPRYPWLNTLLAPYVKNTGGSFEVSRG